MGKKIEKVAWEEHRTVSELIRETFRQYQSQGRLRALALEGRRIAKKKKLQRWRLRRSLSGIGEPVQELTVCLDANVYNSGIVFGGKPLKVLQRALDCECLVVTGPNILEEVEWNLYCKQGSKGLRVGCFLSGIADVSSIFAPSGKTQCIKHAQNNLVLALALAGGCDVLVTEDKKHLLRLGNFQGLTFESLSAFLLRLDQIK